MKEIFNDYLNQNKKIFEQMNNYLEINKDILNNLYRADMLVNIRDHFNEINSNSNLKCTVYYASLHLINFSPNSDNEHFKRLECHVNMGNKTFDKFNLHSIFLKKQIEIESELYKSLKNKYNFSTLKTKVDINYKIEQDNLSITIQSRDFIRTAHYPNNTIENLDSLIPTGGNRYKTEAEEKVEKDIEKTLKTIQKIYTVYPEEILNMIVKGKKLSLDLIENLSLVNDIKADNLTNYDFFINIKNEINREKKSNIKKIKKGNNI